MFFKTVQQTVEMCIQMKARITDQFEALEKPNLWYQYIIPKVNYAYKDKYL